MATPLSLDDRNTAFVGDRRCNACGGQRFSVMGHRSDGMTILRCDACSLGVVEVVPTQPEAFYDDAYYGSDKADNGVGYGDYQFTAEHGLSWAVALVQLLKSGGRILDVGCVDGTLLARLPDSFERYGIEVNQNMAACAARRGVRILGRDLLDNSILHEQCGRFDVVTSIAVFEHLTDIRRGIKVSLDLLKPDGMLLFEVPYISAEHENQVWFESSLEHVFYPSGNALRWLVEDLGAYLVGGEVNIRDYASTYIGIAFRNRNVANHLQRLFDALTSIEGGLPTKEQQRARQQLMLIHAAQSTPYLLEGLGSLSTSTITSALLKRIEQLWDNDLRRLTAARQEVGRLAADLTALRRERNESLTNFARFLEGTKLRFYQLQEHANDLGQELICRQAEIERLRVELDYVVGSTAWQMTYPLRQIGNRAPLLARLFRQTIKLIWWSLRLELPSRLREVAERRKLALQAPSNAKPLEEPPHIVIPPLSFLQENGLVLPLTEDDEMVPWPADRPLVSVVVTSFNYGQFVAEAVDSVLAQTFTDLEVIVVEGGSTDPKSRELTLTLDRPRTRILAQDTPHFVGANRNLGISHARGKYVCCLDADDMLAPTYIEKAVFLLETDGYDVVSCATRMFGNQSDMIGLLETPTLNDMLEGNQVLTCAVFRRSLWRKSQGFQDSDPKISGYVYEDWLFWTKLAAMGARIHNMSRDHLFLYRRHGPSISTERDQHPLDVHRRLIRNALADLLGTTDMLHGRINVAEERRSQKEQLVNLLRLSSDGARNPVLLLALPFTIVGGAERLLSCVVGYLAAQGWRVLITTSIDPGSEHGDTTGWFESTTSEIYHLPRFLPPERWQKFVHYLVSSRGVDVLWVAGSTFMYEQLPDLRMKFPQIRVADSLFNAVAHTTNNRKYAKLIDVTFVENREVQQFLRASGEAEERIALVPSGVDLQTYQPSPRDPCVSKVIGIASDELIVGFSGRWSEEKNPLAFIEIARRTVHLPVRFVMTGTGAMRGAIEAALSSARLPEGRFHLIGEVKDLLPWLRSYDVLVLPSRLDGRPVVVLEALALGVPVVASRVGAMPELIVDGVNGLLCPAGDLDAFVESLGRLTRDHDLLTRMKIAARAHAEQHLDARSMLSLYGERLHLLAQGTTGQLADIEYLSP